MSDSATKNTPAELTAARHPSGPRRRRPASPQSQLVPFKRGCDEIGLPYTTGRDLARRGEIPIVKFGDGRRAHWFVRRSDLTALSERRTERMTG
jgi:hypothetical protein